MLCSRPQRPRRRPRSGNPHETLAGGGCRPRSGPALQGPARRRGEPGLLERADPHRDTASPFPTKSRPRRRLCASAAREVWTPRARSSTLSSRPLARMRYRPPDICTGLLSTMPITMTPALTVTHFGRRSRPCFSRRCQYHCRPTYPCHCLPPILPWRHRLTPPRPRSC